jgi:hypothetical protein
VLQGQQTTLAGSASLVVGCCTASINTVILRSSWWYYSLFCCCFLEEAAMPLHTFFWEAGGEQVCLTGSFNGWSNTTTMPKEDGAFGQRLPCVVLCNV